MVRENNCADKCLTLLKVGGIHTLNQLAADEFGRLWAIPQHQIKRLEISLAI